MSKRRKRPKGRHPGGGRVTPKGTRPGGSDEPQLRSVPAPPRPRLPDDPVMEIARGLAEVDNGDDPLPVELWATQLIGSMTASLRSSSPWFDDEDDDEDWGPGGPPTEEAFLIGLAQSFAERLEGPSGRFAAASLAAILPYLPDDAAKIAHRALGPTPRSPSWARMIGTARVERSLLMTHETDDAEQVALVARYPGTDRTFLVMALIDLNLGGLAKDLLAADDVQMVLDLSAADGIDVRDLDPAEARARVEDALRVSDMTIDAPVSEELDELRPLLERLLATMPEAAELPEPAPPESAELEALARRLAERAATASADFDADELFEAAELMIDYVATWMGRPPLTWSPVRVELFLMDFVPRKVAVPPEQLIDLPERMAALVPAAHHLAGWEDRYVADTLEVIERFADHFRSIISDPAAGGPVKQMMMRAIAEGIDLADPAALEQMVERINAMGGIDAFAQAADLTYPLPEPMDTSILAGPLRRRVAEIDELLMELCVELFDPEHLEMSRALLVRLANEHPDELVRGLPDGWGGGIPYALCQINKMFTNHWRSDLDVQAADVVEMTGLSQQTLTQRAKQVRQLLDLDHWPPPEHYWRSDVRRRHEILTARLDDEIPHPGD